MTRHSLHLEATHLRAVLTVSQLTICDPVQALIHVLALNLPVLVSDLGSEDAHGCFRFSTTLQSSVVKSFEALVLDLQKRCSTNM